MAIAWANTKKFRKDVYKRQGPHATGWDRRKTSRRLHPLMPTPTDCIPQGSASCTLWRFRDNGPSPHEGDSERIETGAATAAQPAHRCLYRGSARGHRDGTGAAARRQHPVSYTHLDVYKRQVDDGLQRRRIVGRAVADRRGDRRQRTGTDCVRAAGGG